MAKGLALGFLQGLANAIPVLPTCPMGAGLAFCAGVCRQVQRRGHQTEEVPGMVPGTARTHIEDQYRPPDPREGPGFEVSWGGYSGTPRPKHSTDQ